MNEPIVVDLFNGIQLNIKKEYTTDTYNQMDESQKLLCRLNDGNNDKINILLFYIPEVLKYSKKSIVMEVRSAVARMRNEVVFTRLHVICQNSALSTHFT